MRKKELMKRLSDLVLTVEDLNHKIKYLTAENEELKTKILNMSETSEKDEIVENDVVEDTVVETIITEGFTVKEADEIDFDSVKELPVTEITSKPEPILNDDALEYGAGVIGKITVESAKYCDKITDKGGANVRELLGLIMGKSEVCKSDILSIAMSDASPESKHELIDAQFTEALDYFKSILEQ